MAHRFFFDDFSPSFWILLSTTCAAHKDCAEHYYYFFYIQLRSHLHFCTHFYIFTHNLLWSVNIYTYIVTDFMKLVLCIETNVRGKGFLYIISELKNKSQSISHKSNHSGSQGVKHCDMSFLPTNKHKYSSDHERTAFSV